MGTDIFYGLKSSHAGDPQPASKQQFLARMAEYQQALSGHPLDRGRIVRDGIRYYLTNYCRQLHDEFVDMAISSASKLESTNNATVSRGVAEMQTYLEMYCTMHSYDQGSRSFNDVAGCFIAVHGALSKSASSGNPMFQSMMDSLKPSLRTLEEAFENPSSSFSDANLMALILAPVNMEFSFFKTPVVSASQTRSSSNAGWGGWNQASSSASSAAKQERIESAAGAAGCAGRAILSIVIGGIALLFWVSCASAAFS
jgi:hypothetical protein